MSEQKTRKPVDIEAFNKRVANLAKEEDIPLALAEIAVRKYPYGQSFSSNYQQDKNASSFIFAIKDEEKSFRSSVKGIDEYIQLWLCPRVGELSKKEKEAIKEYWLSKDA